jgi:ABC-2 type transport system permease protein
MLLRTWTIAWKELIQIIRDPRTLAVVVVMPLVMLVLYGYAINFDVKHVKLGVYDQDRSAVSRDLLGAFSHGERFDVAAHLTSYRQVSDALDRGMLKAVLVIPTKFAEDLARGRAAQVQLLVDGSDSTTASTAIGYAEAMMRQYSAAGARGASRVQAPKGALAALRRAEPVDLRLRFWYNPELKSSDFIVPGLIATLLMMLAGLLTSMTVVRERERGTIEQLIVSPVAPHELMIGKLLPYVAISFFDIVLVIAAGRLLFGVPMRGSAALLLLMSGVFVMAALGIGLLVSVISGSQQTAMLAAMLSTLLPSVLLSGFVFPISSMPLPIQWVTYLIPARHFLVILRGIFLKGSGLSLLWQPAVVLLVYGLVMLGLSAWRFRKRL